MHCPMWAMHLSHLPGSSRSVSQVCHESTVPGVLCVSSGDLISGCDTYGRYQLSRIPGRRGEQLGACSVWWKMPSLGPRLQQPLAFRLWLSLACLSASREGGPYMAAGLLSFGICSILCSVSVPGVLIEPFVRKVSFVCLSGDPTVWVAVSH